MKKRKKLSLKKVNIAPIDYLKIIRGGIDQVALDPNDLYIVSQSTDPRTDCEATVTNTSCPLTLQETCTPTTVKRGNGSI